jgi:hypothetical protein
VRRESDGGLRREGLLENKTHLATLLVLITLPMTPSGALYEMIFKTMATYPTNWALLGGDTAYTKARKARHPAVEKASSRR